MRKATPAEQIHALMCEVAELQAQALLVREAAQALYSEIERVQYHKMPPCTFGGKIIEFANNLGAALAKEPG